MPGAASAQVWQEWAAQYNSGSNGGDIGRKITIDNSGNIIVTGSSGTSFAYNYRTIKYDPMGQQIWTVNFAGVNINHDEPSGIVHDNFDNIYICGTSGSGFSNSDYVIVKYSQDGQQVWAKYYNGAAGYLDVASSMTLKDEYLYVTGSSYTSNMNHCVTLKYNLNGALIWSAIDSVPSFSVGNDIAVNNQGDVCITGHWGAPGYSYGSWFTILYDSNGVEQWRTDYYGPGNNYNMGYKVKFDPNGNIVVAGFTAGVGTASDFCVIKYDHQGNMIWINNYNGPMSWSEEATCLAVDEYGYIYAAGWSDGVGTGQDILVSRYSPGGTQQWVYRYTGPSYGDDNANDIVLDQSGTVYITGSTFNSTTMQNCITIKVDSIGHANWLVQYNGVANGNDAGYGIRRDADLNIYVVGNNYAIG
jgi:hypothetical protein